MFEIGEQVVYGSCGVCTVKEICVSPFGGGDLRNYYVLQPLDDHASVIYTPANGGKVVLRKLLSKEEAEDVLKHSKEFGQIVVHTDKQRREAYREAMSKADPIEYIKIIHTVIHRRDTLSRSRRNLSLSDTEFERNAKYCLFTEFSIILEMTFEELESIFGFES